MERRYCSRCLQTFVAPGPDVCSRSGCRSSRPMAGWPGFFKFGEIIDERYRIEEILGAGGAGVTYRCVDMLCGEETALKILHADRERGTLANRLLIEGECLELLEHEHIVPFRALRIVGQGPYYLATLHMRGGSLDRQVKRHGPLSPAGTLELGRQVVLLRLAKPVEHLIPHRAHAKRAHAISRQRRLRRRRRRPGRRRARAGRARRAEAQTERHPRHDKLARVQAAQLHIEHGADGRARVR